MIVNEVSKYVVSPPILYQDEFGKVFDFEALKESTKDKIISLLQRVSFDALLTKIPVFTVYKSARTVLKVLNFSNYVLNYSASCFILNEKKVLWVNAEDDLKDLYFIVYSTLNYPHIIYFEQMKDDGGMIQRSCLIDRSNILPELDEDELNEKSRFRVIDIQSVTHNFPGPKIPYLSQHPLQIDEYEENLIRKSFDVVSLTWKIPYEASLKWNPNLLKFASRTNFKSCMILNHTDFYIDFDIQDNLRIDHINFKKITFDNSLFIAYHINDDTGTVCFEHKIFGVKEIGLRFFCHLNETKVSEEYNVKVFEKVKKREEAYRLLWPSYGDENSFFIKNDVPKEVLGLIIQNYINV